MKEYRTTQQNRALYKYFRLVSDALNDAGYEMQEFLTSNKVDVPWSAELIKDVIWRPIQKAALQKNSTAELEKTEIDVVYDIVNRFLAKKDIQIPFPSLEEIEIKLKE